MKAGAGGGGRRGFMEERLAWEGRGRRQTAQWVCQASKGTTARGQEPSWRADLVVGAPGGILAELVQGPSEQEEGAGAPSGGHVDGVLTWAQRPERSVSSGGKEWHLLA